MPRQEVFIRWQCVLLPVWKLWQEENTSSSKTHPLPITCCQNDKRSLLSFSPSLSPYHSYYHSHLTNYIFSTLCKKPPFRFAAIQFVRETTLSARVCNYAFLKRFIRLHEEIRYISSLHFRKGEAWRLAQETHFSCIPCGFVSLETRPGGDS